MGLDAGAGWSRAGLARAALALLGIGAIGIGLALPGARLLIDRDDARWLVGATPDYLGMLPMQPRGTFFRRTIELDAPAEHARLEVRAVEQVAVWIDGEERYRNTAPDGLGRRLRRVEIGPLEAGSHQLDVGVLASSSPPLLWLRSADLGLASDDDWLYSHNGVDDTWQPARPATDGPEPFSVSREYPSAGSALLRVLPWLSPVFLLVFWMDRRGGPMPSPGQLRWLLLAAWAALGSHNLLAVPADVGMDLALHLEYVGFLLEERTIPLATQGGEMMQSPLAYLLFAALHAALSGFLDADTLVKALRILPMACGAAQVELGYRAVACTFPDRPELQRVGILVAGLLPVHVYLGHAVANEPVAALLGGALALATLRIAVSPAPGPPSLRAVAAAGALLGLALLTKVTTALLAPALLIAVALRSGTAGRPVRPLLLRLALIAACAGGIAGWYYLRNWWLLGSPFLGTWSAEVGEAWWQLPGYRNALQYLRFGEALLHPIYSGGIGLWDGLYSSLWLDSWLSGAPARPPPWNPSPLVAGAWLAVAPSLALALGCLRGLGVGSGPPSLRLALGLAVGTLALYLVAIAHLHLSAPFYCIAKASYFAAATPYLAVLAAAGAAWLARTPTRRALLTAAVTCWAVNVLASYWSL